MGGTKFTRIAKVHARKNRVQPLVGRKDLRHWQTKFVSIVLGKHGSPVVYAELIIFANRLILVLTHSIPFSADTPADFFTQFPATAAVFALRGADENAEPYVSKAANLRRRLQRLLAPPESQSKRLNLRERVVRIEYEPTGSDFESGVLLYRLLRQEFPRTYQARLRLHHATLIRLNLQNAYPRAYVTNKLGKMSDSSLYYGPFQSRALAEKYMNDSLDLFKIRRCTFELHPDPAFPGCVYSEMKMCLAPCFKGCTDEVYAAEVARVQAYFDSGGETLLQELETERDRLAADLDFEGAAQLHAKVARLKGILSLCDGICRRLDQLDAVLIQPSAESGSVALFRFRKGELWGPERLEVESKQLVEQPEGTDQAKAVSSKPEELLRGALQKLEGHGAKSATQFSESLAILKRWYYRTHKTGEIVLARADGELPMRKIINAVNRVYRGDNDPTISLPPEAHPPA
jgi:excinuclease ABC subunit C